MAAKRGKQLYIIVACALATFISYAIRYSFAYHLFRMAMDWNRPIYVTNKPYELPLEEVGDIDEPEKLLFQNPVRAAILGLYFVGLLIGQIPATIIVQHNGTRYPLGIALIIASLVNFCICLPVMFYDEFEKEWHFTVLLCLMRFAKGLCFSFVLPGTQQLLRMWVNNRRRLLVQQLMSLSSYFGAFFGVMVAVCLGWRFTITNVFLGLMALAIGITFICFVRDEFESYPGIRKGEIMELRTTGSAALPLPVPWSEIPASRRLWTVLVAQFGNSLITHYMELLVPAFYLQMTGRQYGGSAMLRQPSAVVQHTLIFLFPLIGTLAAMVIEQRVVMVARDNWQWNVFVTTRTLRIIFNTVATVPAAIFLILSTVVFNNMWFCLAAFCMLQIVRGFAWGGFKANVYDTTFYFYDQLFQITHFVGNLTAVILMIMYGYTWQAENSRDYFICSFVAVFALICNTMFVILARVDRAKWDGIVR